MRMSEPDTSMANKKQDNLSKIDGIIKDMINDVEEGETLFQPLGNVTTTAMPPTWVDHLFSSTSVILCTNPNPPSF